MPEHKFPEQPNLPPPSLPAYGGGIPGRERILDMGGEPAVPEPPPPEPPPPPPPADEDLDADAEHEEQPEEGSEDARPVHRRRSRSSKR